MVAEAEHGTCGTREQLATLISSVADGIIAIDAGGRLLFANDAAARIAGFGSPAELAATSLDEILGRYEFRDFDGRPIPREELPDMRALGTRALAEASVHVRTKATSEDRYVVLRSAPLLDEAGGLEGVVTVWHDVSSLELAKRELQLNAALLEATCEASPAGVLLISPEKKVLSFNRLFVTLWKLGSKVLDARSERTTLEAIAEKLTEPGLLATQAAHLDAHPEEKSRDDVHLKDGRVVEVYAAPILGPGKQVLGRGWFFRDITFAEEAKQRERLLAAQQEALSAAEDAEQRAGFLSRASEVLASSLDLESALRKLAVLLVPYLADWCVIDLLEPDGAVRRVAVVHSDPLKAPVATRLQQLSAAHRTDATGVPLPQPIVHRVRDGEPLRGWPFLCVDEECGQLARRLGVSSYMTVPMISRSAVIGALSLVGSSNSRCFGYADIRMAEELASRAALAAENSRLYREARDAVRVREEFLSIASHELRTPIASLQLGLEAGLRVLRRSSEQPSWPDMLPRTLAAAERQARRLGQLVDELLDVTRIRAGRLSLELCQVDLAEVVREVVRRHQELATSAGCALVVQAGEGVTGVWDPGRLDQVVSNLLTNALKFGGGKPVEIELGADDAVAWVSVSDHGIGIKPEDQARLFTPFARGAARGYAGLGLGLYIVRRIVEALGGSVEVESAAGEGSTFTVELPRAGPPASRA
ncbi:MAG: PAS domain-containing sensor histidine kinase [Myxococcaceae bacterium]